MSGTFVEIAVNGPWGKRLQPALPIAPNAIIEEALACVELGASIVHFHAYDDEGQQSTDLDLIARICEGIRKEADVLIYPAIRYMPNERSIQSDSGQHRYEHYIELTKQGHADWLIVDPGSTNLIMSKDPKLLEAVVDINTPKAIRYGMELAASLNLNATMAIYDPGYLRYAALLDAALMNAPKPIYRFMFSEQLTFGFPPRIYALEAYMELYNELGLKAPWMIAGLGVDLTDLIGPVVNAGGHIRVGLEDYLLGTVYSNQELMCEVKVLIEDAGGRLGTVDELRTFMGMQRR